MEAAVAMMMVTMVMVMVMAVIMRSYLVFYSTGSMESFGHADRKSVV